MKKSFIHQQEEISFVKNTFTQYLIAKLDVVEVQGPILSRVGMVCKIICPVLKIQYLSMS